MLSIEIVLMIKVSMTERTITYVAFAVIQVPHAGNGGFGNMKKVEEFKSHCFTSKFFLILFVD